MAFIQVQQSVVTHRKTLRLARLLNLDRYAVVGRLVALWSWCLDNALDGALGRDIDPDILADVMAWTSEMGKPGELVDALITVGFLDVDEADQGLCIHDWYDHMGQFIERRQEKLQQDAERKRRQRQREREGALEHGHEAWHEAAAPVTPTPAGRHGVVSRGRHADVTRQEKSREEKSSTTGREGSGGREIAREAPVAPVAPSAAADAALALVSAAPAMASLSSHAPARPPKAPAPIALHPAGLARVPDPVWDACIAAMGQNGAAPSNRVERGKWAKGIQALKESLAADGSPPGEIAVRSARYRARFGASVPLNPMALAGNWTTLAHDVATEREGERRYGSSGRFAGAAGYGRSGERRGGRGGGPQVGAPGYYEQAEARAAAQQRSLG